MIPQVNVLFHFVKIADKKEKFQKMQIGQALEDCGVKKYKNIKKMVNLILSIPCGKYHGNPRQKIPFGTLKLQ